MFPLWVFVVILSLVVTVFIFMRNSRKLRDEFGNEPTDEQVRQKYPKAKIFPVVKK